MELLLKEECISYAWNNRKEVHSAIHNLIIGMCTSETVDAFRPINDQFGNPFRALHEKDKNARLIPITEVWTSYFGYDDLLYAYSPVSDLKNTKHRYSWICSLRRKSEDKRHLCGVTLLSMPPSPTVLVSSAHCVSVCRSEAMNKVLDNCCCANVGGEICSDNPECEDDAKIVTLTGVDAEIICGEWETGPTPASDSGEEYNIILPIKNIIIHPNYSISRGELNSQFVANDLAVFIVDDKELMQSEDKIVPICLPSSKNQPPTIAIHSGWSSPPPVEFLEQNLPDYVTYHQEFFKQWHYRMNVTKCEDPNQDYKFSSNSSYPPGVLCALEQLNEFCPSSGESGSPLMYQENNKFVMTGLLSFVKGCTSFIYSGLQGLGVFRSPRVSRPYYESLTQESLNPLVYTKISCYLPWIAEQYGMEYEAEADDDPECVNYTGDINEVTAEVCTVFPTQYFADGLYLDNTEAKCIFNFTIDDGTNAVEWDGCAISGIEDFTHPVFKCPIRTIRNRPSNYYFSNYKKSNGKRVNEVVNAVYCPTNSVGAVTSGVGVAATVEYTFNSDGPVFGPNGEYELDPENDECSDLFGQFSFLPVFGTCKNNCRGGKN